MRYYAKKQSSRSLVYNRNVDLTSSIQIRILILSREAGCLFRDWMNSAKYLKQQLFSVILSMKTHIGLYFQKLFLVGQNFKALSCDIFFDELLVFFWITLLDIFCLKFEWKNYCTQIHISKETNDEKKQSQIHFHLSQTLILKNSRYP